MIIDGRNIPSLSTASKCEKYLKPIQKKKKIDLEAIGSPNNNMLLDFLKCQVKANKKKTLCKNIQKAYFKCHSSVMGTGSYDNRKNCGKELNAYFTCAMEENEIIA